MQIIKFLSQWEISKTLEWCKTKEKSLSQMSSACKWLIFVRTVDCHLKRSRTCLGSVMTTLERSSRFTCKRTGRAGRGTLRMRPNLRDNKSPTVCTIMLTMKILRSLTSQLVATTESGATMINSRSLLVLILKPVRTAAFVWMSSQISIIFSLTTKIPV